MFWKAEIKNFVFKSGQLKLVIRTSEQNASSKCVEGVELVATDRYSLKTTWRPRVLFRGLGGRQEPDEGAHTIETQNLTSPKLAAEYHLSIYMTYTDHLGFLGPQISSRLNTFSYTYSEVSNKRTCSTLIEFPEKSSSHMPF